MYIPAPFAVEDVSRLHAFMAAHSFALLVCSHDDGPLATHLPLLIEPNGDSTAHTGGDTPIEPYGTLIGHVARANPHWRELTQGDVMAAFTGPHAYISPTWYAAENVVPTWNYVAVHAYGTVELIEDERTILDILRRTVDHYERTQSEPWSFADDDAFIRKLAAAVVAFRIKITRLEGKWKLNQNLPAQRRQGVIDALSRQGDEYSQAIARLMEEAGEDRSANG